MSALGYLFFTRIKNGLRETVRRPARLVLYVFFAALLVFVLVAGGRIEPSESYRDVTELYAIALVFYGFAYVAGILPGLGSGATFYSMADVNLLFPGPISSKRILLYGLVRQLGNTLMIGFFLLFQYTWLHGSYGVTVPGMVGLVLGFGLVTFCAQLTAMWIYCVSSASDGRKRAIRWTIYAVVAAALAWVALPVLSGGTDGLMTALAERAGSPAMMVFPVAGWVAALVRGALTGSWLYIALGLGATGLFVLVFVLVILRLNADFYEDVLLATEVSHSAVTAQKEGNLQETGRKNIRLGKTGIRRGRGASALFYKHLLESRRAGFFIFDPMTLVMMAVPIVLALFLREEGFLICLMASCYTLFVTTGGGRWAREFTKPYIYMIPQSPFRKLVMACGENIFKCALESAVTLLVVGLICRAAPAEIAVALILRMGVGLVLIAVTVVMERLFGGITTPGLVLVLYLVTLLVILAPGIVLGLGIALVLGLPAVTALAVFTLWCYGVSFLLIFLCRNMLVWAELNNR